MSSGITIRIAFLAIALIACSWQPCAVAQSAKPASPRTQNPDALLDQSFNAMYNLRFDEAFRLAEAANRMANDDPVPWMAQACAVLFREFDYMHILRSELFGRTTVYRRSAMAWDPQRRKDFDNALIGTEKLAQAGLKQNKNDARALFALTLVTVCAPTMPL